MSVDFMDQGVQYFIKDKNLGSLWYREPIPDLSKFVNLFNHYSKHGTDAFINQGLQVLHSFFITQVKTELVLDLNPQRKCTCTVRCTPSHKSTALGKDIVITSFVPSWLSCPAPRLCRAHLHPPSEQTSWGWGLHAWKGMHRCKWKPNILL